VQKIKSLRMKLFITLASTLIVIIVSLILLNNIVLRSFYLFSKKQDLMRVYYLINNYYNSENDEIDIELELEKISIKNNFDILIKTESNIGVYSSNKNFLSRILEKEFPVTPLQKENIIYSKDGIVIHKAYDSKNGLNYIMLSATLDNGYTLNVRVPIASIDESVRISNEFLCIIGVFTIIISGVIVSVISRKFTDPIYELNTIAKKISKLDFTHKYYITDTDDEINELGKSINTMSDTMERVIKQLRDSNIELEKDIEEKSKIDEMRKQFISDVSHELKTPIALIQGYAEGLLENVNTDDESRKFYAEVILDESNKMDILVKQLLELMKLEYGKREFNNVKFNLIELEKEVIRKSKVMIEEKHINIQFKEDDPIYVYGDTFYIEQIVTNYLTNAIKHVKEVNGIKEIKLENIIKDNKVRISIFNTGDNISEENQSRIWNRFYKIDESRNRNDGGSGIGLSIVKAIMNNYKNEYGTKNRGNGVEFYFELNLYL